MTDRVNISGLGTVPAKFSIKFDGFDFAQTNKTNRHNEKYVAASISRDDWANDDFNLSCEQAGSSYKCSIALNSEVPVSLYNNGTVSFTYNPSTQHWIMRGEKVVGGEGCSSPTAEPWSFCSPDAVLSQMLAGLKALTAEAEENKSDVELIAQSIERDSANIIASADRYQNQTDCEEISIIERHEAEEKRIQESRSSDPSPYENMIW